MKEKGNGQSLREKREVNRRKVMLIEVGREKKRDEDNKKKEII